MALCETALTPEKESDIAFATKRAMSADARLLGLLIQMNSIADTLYGGAPAQPTGQGGKTPEVPAMVRLEYSLNDLHSTIDHLETAFARFGRL